MPAANQTQNLNPARSASPCSQHSADFRDRSPINTGASRPNLRTAIELLRRRIRSLRRCQQRAIVSCNSDQRGATIAESSSHDPSLSFLNAIVDYARLFLSPLDFLAFFHRNNPNGRRSFFGATPAGLQPFNRQIATLRTPAKATQTASGTRHQAAILSSR